MANGHNLVRCKRCSFTYTESEGIPGTCRGRVRSGEDEEGNPTYKPCDGTLTVGRKPRDATYGFKITISPPGAPRRQRTQSGFETKRARDAARLEMAGDVAGGRYNPPTKVMTGEFLGTWLDAHRGKIRASTWDSYKVVLGKYVIPRIGDIPLSALTRRHIQAMYVELGESGRERDGGPLSAKSVHNVHIALRRALSDAAEDHLIPSNPADRAHQLASDHRPEIRAWTHQQLRAFLESVAGERDYVLYRVAAFTGMRRGELLGLPWDAVDLDRRLVTINRALLVDGDGGVRFAPPKTQRGRRTIDIDPVTADSLRSWRARQSEERLAMGKGWEDSGLVFTRQDGTPLSPSTVSKKFEGMQGKVEGIPTIRLHDLRHTHATLLLANGVPLHVVSRRLGHASEAFTAEVYSHVLPNQQADAVAQLAMRVDGNGVDDLGGIVEDA